ncbi:MAG: hypothetical protein AAGD00_04245 [Planctomycetota bacterium]
MDGSSTERRARLENLLHLARVSRGISRAKLARSLGRDPTKILPDSGNPKIDYVVKLAEVLEWPVGDVVDAIWKGHSPTQDPAPATDESFESLNRLLLDAIGGGRFREAVGIAQRMFSVARTAEERAHACVREAAGWDGLGRYAKVEDAARRGLGQSGMSLRLRLVLQATLANAQYALWDLVPALGTCEVLARWYEENPPERRREFKRVAYVRYVRGNTLRRLAATEPERAELHAAAAKRDLEYAADLYTSLAEELGEPALEALAHTCRGGLIELETMIGTRGPEEAVEEIVGVIEGADLSESAHGDWIESIGWWCVFGSSIALRHLEGRALQRAVQCLVNRGLEVAERADQWALRERLFSLQFQLHRTVEEATGLDLQLSLDDRTRANITGAMGRFPRFSETGWHMLETAHVIPSQREGVDA